MSRSDGSGWFPSSPKKPPPEHGIKVKKPGSTWWGQRWIAALEQVLRGDSGRLGRGRTYARAGRTHDLIVQSGTVTAKVTGSRAEPYQIEIALTQLSAATWERAIAGMAKQAQFAAELLAGHMPQAIDEVFRKAGTSLFPAQRSDLKTKCSCPDWGDPCKHVAAAHYVLGDALDRDPFLLFELRGRSKPQVLDALRAARLGTTPEQISAQHAQPELEIAKVTLGEIAGGDYDRPRAALPNLQFAFDAPVTHGATLRQLGAPPAWGAIGSPADLLAPLVHAAAQRAREMALAEPEPQSDPNDLDAPAADGGAKPRAKPAKHAGTATPPAAKATRKRAKRRSRSAAPDR
jgi:uncharacterized Zn finger protein